MARKRYIKPSLFENEILGDNAADPLYTLLFCGLWGIADREGRLKDRPLKIKADIFPYRNIADPDSMIQWLADQGFIARYQADGRRYIQIVNWHEHQTPHNNEVASVIPAHAADPDTSPNGASAVTNGASTSLLNSYSYSDSNSDLVSANAGGSAAVDGDPVERRIWTDGVELLSRSGKMTEASARSLLGRLAKQHTKHDVAIAVAATQAENSIDPKAFLIGVLKERDKGRVAMLVGKEPTAGCPECHDGWVDDTAFMQGHPAPCPSCRPDEYAWCKAQYDRPGHVSRPAMAAGPC